MSEMFERRANHFARKFSRQIALAAVNAERDRQDQKWGDIKTFQGRRAETWLTILVEEVGELAQAMLNESIGGPLPAKRNEEIEHECIQVAAVAVSILEWIEEKKARDLPKIPLAGRSV